MQNLRAWLQAQFEKGRSFYRVSTRRFFVTVFVVGLVAGAVLKSALTGVITMGYDDYRVHTARAVEDLNRIQKQMEESGKVPGVLETQAATEGKVCAE